MSTPQEISPPSVKKTAGRKSVIILLLISTFLVAVYFFIFELMVPKTAPLAVPHKWKRIPLRQNKEIVRAYFGSPDSGKSSSVRDEWFSGSKDKMYNLRIYYIYDTVAASYSIHYRYDKWFSKRDYVIDTGAIR